MHVRMYVHTYAYAYIYACVDVYINLYDYAQNTPDTLCAVDRPSQNSSDNSVATFLASVTVEQCINSLCAGDNKFATRHYFTNNTL